MRLITSDGVQAVFIADEDERSLVARHANAVAQFLATGDTDPLVEFVDTEVAGHRLETDPDALEAWAAEGELEFEDIYNETGR
jgi:hypothetical protein